MKTLYVCTGNRFRSLIAEGLTSKYTDHDAKSRGTEATGPIKDEFRALLEENDLIDYIELKPQQLDQNTVDWADKTIAMKDEHRDYVLENYEIDENQVDIWNIPDSYEGYTVEEIYRKIEEKVKAL